MFDLLNRLMLCVVAALALAVAPAMSFAQESEAAEVTSDSEVHDEAEHSGDAAEHSDAEHSDGAHGGGADHGDEHVDNDPTHANVSEATYGVTEFRTDMALFTAVVFVLLLLGLSFTAWKPIMDGLEKRESTIANNIANAERASAEAESKLAKYEAQLAKAAEEAQQIVADARKDGEAAGQKIVAAAQEEAVRLKERATADIESAKRVALGDLASQSTEVAMSLASRVVGREVKADDHQGLIQEMLSKLPSNN